MFVEYSTGEPAHTQSQMYRHFWDIFRANGGGNSVTTPMITVDEFQWFDGTKQQFDKEYSAAIDRAQRRRAGAIIETAWKQNGNDVVVQARITNKLGQKLGAANSAQLHAILWVEQKKYYSPDAAIKDASGGLCAELENEATATCQITIPGVNAAGPKSHVTVALDYLPDPGRRQWDMVQTANAMEGELPAPPDPDLPPTVFSPIADVTVEQDADPMVIDLGGVFTDPDNDDKDIVKQVVANSWPGLLTPSIEGNSLTLTFAPGMSGDAEITIRGVSNGKHVDDTFVVTVLPPPADQPPVVANPLADRTVEQGAEPLVIDLTDTFSDPDNDPTGIVKEVVGNSNTSLVTTRLEGNTLTLTFSPTAFGSATISLRASSNGLTVEDRFEVTVLPKERPPSIYLPMGLRGQRLR
ncbi:MAG: hypothetical protein H6648_10770 [Caldilineae bacterium]|nr:hypothetical protein [Caldilineae bacterium]